MASSNVKSLDVVAGLIFNQDRVLVCQRNHQSTFALKWEFPGGKVEPGEEPESALRRELREELGIDAGLLNEFSRHEHLYNNKDIKVNLRFFWVTGYSGEVKNLVFEQIKWVPIRELNRMDFLEADLPLVRELTAR